MYIAMVTGLHTAHGACVHALTEGRMKGQSARPVLFFYCALYKQRTLVLIVVEQLAL